MGTDIHMRAEIQMLNHKGEPYWKAVGHAFKNTSYDPAKAPVGWNVPFTDEPYGDRNYDLFAMLADVRNGTGFAGVETGTGFVPISEPRGFPADMGWEIKEWIYGDDERSGDDYGGHSASWVTLDELKAYDWKGQTTKHYGMVGRAGYQEWKSEGKPSCYSGGVSGGSIKTVSNDEMERIIAEHGVPDSSGPFDFDTYYTRVEWEESYYECVSDFVDRVIPELERMAEFPDVQAVRLVFYFDS